MINGASAFIFSCRHHAVGGQLRAGVPETLDLPIHLIDRRVKILSGEHSGSGFVTDNALTVRHLDPDGRLNTHSPRLHIAQRHRLRGFLP